MTEAGVWLSRHVECHLMHSSVLDPRFFFGAFLVSPSFCI
jgi:hypothetical protein